MVKESIFNPDHQAGSVPSKVVAAMERLSEAFRVLLWNEAKQHGISSTIQIQILTFLLYYPESKRTITYLANYFNMTKATISDAVKALESKGLVVRKANVTDTRSHTLLLSREGKTIARKVEKFAHPMQQAVLNLAPEKQNLLLEQLLKLIGHLNEQGVITPQSMCGNCQYYAAKGRTGHYCTLVQMMLRVTDLKLDCPDFEPLAAKY
ncbi:MarR family winged helix-turn-helix transcriptional regulator [Chitinophaga sedimenti]|uniref:MarR family winged helix-turn-helix transcriptional regulator n=1 Tax=Chitinophaga sedimenti TaxID=2033606 RepID=UPI002003A53E|nr:MarR family winged helix-turn-helix transcriptional regulator [Chitinophaga sedimenti]MCK7558280.1 MarR family winged helix-turn-helix transcriptional regulator [Chitinophaga sedimenti]